MNILFIMLSCQDLDKSRSGFYTDLVYEFVDRGHVVTIIAPTIFKKQKSGIYCESKVKVLRVKTLETQGVNNVIKKGLALAYMPLAYKLAYKKYLAKEAFDLIFMPTPSVTLIDVAAYIKKETKSRLYIILRDIHPQSLKSIGLCNNKLMYSYLERKANRMYKNADWIGCMSPRNIEFVNSITNFAYKAKVVLLPNWMKYSDYIEPDIKIREKYGLKDKYIAIFGGTIGAGQAVWNIITLSKHYIKNDDVVFLIVGKGVRKDYLMQQVIKERLSNIRFIDFMPRDEYESILRSADVGLISLDEKYAVPTCPSKIIGYMAMKIPVVAMINRGSDYGEFYIDASGIGLWSEGLNNNKMFENFDRIYLDKELRNKMKESGFVFFKNNLTSENAYTCIVNQIKWES